MIVPMKKILLLLYHREKETFLSSLQELGVVHVNENPQMRSDALETLQNQGKAADRVLKALKKISKAEKTAPAQSTTGNAEEIITRFDELEARREKIEQNIVAIKKSINVLGPWGDFEPASVERLEQAGISMRFFTVNEKKFNALHKEDLQYKIINKIGSTVYLVILERGEKAALDAEEILLPKISLSEARRKLTALQTENQGVTQEIEKLVKYQDVVKFYLSNQNAHSALESAHLSMEEGAEGRVVSLTGWVPAQREKKVAAFLDEFSAWYEFSEPTHDDEIPVLIKNNPFSKLFEPITKLFQLPNYYEVDPTAFIAPFFALFFGNCLGDAGYGLVIFIITTILQFKIKGNAKLLVALGQVLGIATLIMGIVNTGTVFGMAMKDNLNIPLFALLHKATVITDDVMISPFNFALLLGVIQINVGMILNIFNRIKYFSFKHSLPVFGKIFIVNSCVLLFLILAQNMQGLKPLLLYAVFFLILGIALLAYIAFFTDLEQYLDIKIVNFILKLYFVLSGAVGDILSYIRLFALGLSSGILGYVVNVIGSQFISIPYVGWIIFIIFLIVGHTGNLVLAALGSFVHPLRLTFVEFYNNLEFTGSRTEYKPLNKFMERSQA